jgi:hypothetical protein
VRIVGLAVVALSLAFAAPANAQECSKETATRAVNEHELNAFLLPDPVMQVLCGSFTGPGSTAMAVTIAASTCWSPQFWAVFDFAGGAWRPVYDEWTFVAADLEAVGDDLRVTTAVHQIGDGRCGPSGGTEARIFHWDGSRLIAGEPTQVKPRTPLESAYFGIARKGECLMTQRWVRCEFTRQGRKREAKLSRAGETAIQLVRRNRCGCDERPSTNLLPGRTAYVGRFRCEATRFGVRCTIVATGKGFEIDRGRAVRIRVR